MGSVVLALVVGCGSGETVEPPPAESGAPAAGSADAATPVRDAGDAAPGDASPSLDAGRAAPDGASGALPGADARAADASPDDGGSRADAMARGDAGDGVPAPVACIAEGYGCMVDDRKCCAGATCASAGFGFFCARACVLDTDCPSGCCAPLAGSSVRACLALTFCSQPDGAAAASPG